MILHQKVSCLRNNQSSHVYLILGLIFICISLSSHPLYSFLSPFWSSRTYARRLSLSYWHALASRIPKYYRGLYFQNSPLHVAFNRHEIGEFNLNRGYLTLVIMKISYLVPSSLRRNYLYFIKT